MMNRVLTLGMNPQADFPLNGVKARANHLDVKPFILQKQATDAFHPLQFGADSDKPGPFSKAFKRIGTLATLVSASLMSLVGCGVNPQEGIPIDSNQTVESLDAESSDAIEEMKKNTEISGFVKMKV
ncbi:MAG: hypothetical protein K2X66_10040, partial [Cyanobacteria bacterium]|nr:hypothetical protein [Cyanobacteriota bacterium]